MKMKERFNKNRFKTLQNPKKIATFTLLLLLTITPSIFVAQSFAAEDTNGNRLVYPVPAYKMSGPSPWYCSAFVGGMYNLSCTNYNPTSKAPNTAHMLWAFQYRMGGATGGTEQQGAAGLGFVENGRFASSAGSIGCVAAGGNVYFASGSRTASKESYTTLFCVDENTGEQKWSTVLPLASLKTMTLRNYITGVDAGTSILMFGFMGDKTIEVDATTGKIITNYTVSGTLLTDPFFQWDYSLYSSSPNDAPKGYMYSSNIASKQIFYLSAYKLDDKTGTVTFDWKVLGGWPKAISDDILITYGIYPMNYIMSAINVTSHTILWEKPFASMNDGSIAYGNYYTPGGDGRMYCFNLETGDEIWKTDLGCGTPFYAEHGSSAVGEGKIYVNNYDGFTYCLDAFTGALLWSRYAGNCPYEPYASTYGTWPAIEPPKGADGKIYVVSGDHNEREPSIPGEKLTCYNGTTGDILWQYPANQRSEGFSSAIADGLLFVPDIYTNQVLCFGKGDTAVDVSVPNAQIAKGEYTWITGTVTDQSPAQPGTPCVSTADMESWMAYLHANENSTTGKKGVTLTLYAEDPYGNTITIGDVKTNGDTGEFATQWIPPAEGKYIITGTFVGDDSYWGSYGSTVLTVGAHQATASNTSTTTSTVPATTAAISFVAIAVVITGAISTQKRKLKKVEES